MIDIAIVDENGNVQLQLRDEALVRSFNEIVRQHGHNPDFCCLRFLDPYGDTTFNRLQVAEVIREMDEIASNGVDEEALAAMDAVRKLAGQVKIEPHLYLKFIGD